jgi:hypothetical protein
MTPTERIIERATERMKAGGTLTPEERRQAAAALATLTIGHKG